MKLNKYKKLIWLILVSFGFLFSIHFWDYTNIVDLYNKNQYDAIIEKYQKTRFPKFSPENMHNVWNALVKKWEKASSKDPSMLEQALKIYSGSLAQEENHKTRHNYEYVKELLSHQKSQDSSKEDSSQNQEQSSQNDRSQESDTQERSSENQQDDKEDENTESNAESSEKKDESSSQQEGLEWSGWIEEDTLSQREKKQAEEYIENMRNSQKWYQNNYGKHHSGNDDFWQLFESFFGEIDRWWEKDW